MDIQHFDVENVPVCVLLLVDQRLHIRAAKVQALIDKRQTVSDVLADVAHRIGDVLAFCVTCKRKSCARELGAQLLETQSKQHNDCRRGVGRDARALAPLAKMADEIRVNTFVDTLPSRCICES